jgi:diguanylate cyclase (GGDEF)-like protein
MMLTKWRLEIILVALVLITLLAIAAEKKILQAAMVITPQSGHLIELYDDSRAGGNSHAEITNLQNFQWRCTLKDKYAYPHCGFEIIFDPNREHGLDLSHVTKVRLWLDYQGPNKTLRVYLRNFDPRYSSVEIEQSTKFNQIEFSTDLLKDQPLEFSLNDFFVADWWLLEFNIPPKLRHPQFDNIIMVEVQTGSKEPLGEHNFQLKKVELVGQRLTTEKWYLFIMSSWLGIFVIFLGYRIALLNNQVRSQKKRESELLEINSLLDVRSKQLEEKSKTDFLTGAFNRQGIEDAIRIGLWEWRSQKKPLSLILIDIDHFKKINDEHGHAIGDHVLSALSNIVKQHIRSNDLFARWGGEEFVLLCRDTKIEQASLIAEKIRELIASFAFKDNVQVTASFGVATLNANETLEQLFNHADKALYEAKHQGRNKVIVAEYV